MKTNKLIFSPKVTSDGHQSFNELYEEFHKSYPTVHTMVESMSNKNSEAKVDIDFKSIYKPNHACIWNRPKDIGREVHIAAQSTDKLFVIVLFCDDFKAQVYRTEDVTVKDSMYDKMILES